ncbi:hypothetical protein AB0P04_42715, partial [Streptomyces anulatus]
LARLGEQLLGLLHITGGRPAVDRGSLLATLVLLGMTQRFLRRRFRRILNVPLLAATVLVIGLASMTSLAHVSKDRLDGADTMTQQVVETRQDEADAERRFGDRQLQRLLSPVCEDLDRCGPTVSQERDASRNAAGDAKPPSLSDAAGIREVNRQMRGAAEYAGWAFLIPLLSIAIGALVWGGIHPRLEEYRYQPR